MIELVVLPYEGCLWSDARVVSGEEAAVSVHSNPKPNALVFACGWVGEGECRRPIGWAYDFTIAQLKPEMSPWRRLV